MVIGHSLVPTGAGAAVPSALDAAGVELTRLQARQAPSRTSLLKPNLVVLPAADLYVQHGATGRRLRFESALGNVGRGPVEVRPNFNHPCPPGKHHATQILFRDMDGSKRFRRDRDTQVARRSAGCMVFHPQHDHWHFEAASRYLLFKAGQREGARVARRKMSFCLRDSRRLPSSYGTWRYAQHYGACSRYSPQGISIGWVDVYQSFLAGQALRLPERMGDGLYCLQINVDPRNMLLESNDDDNMSMRAFYLRGDSVSLRRPTRCLRS